jgi:hypothetical protein
MATPPIPRLVSAAEHLYRLSLAAYPPAFRRAYGEPMAQVFGDCCRSAWRHGGTSGVLDLWARALFDLVRTAPAERVKEAWQMSPRTILSRWAGPAAILGGLLWIWLLVGSRDNVERDPLVLFMLVPVLFLAGVASLATRRPSWLSMAGLIVSALGVLVWAAGPFVEQDWWFFFVGGVLLISLGTGLVGFSTMMTGVLSRWRAVPLIIGLWPILLQVTNPYQYAWADPNGWLGDVQHILFVAYGLGWMLLGYALWSSAGRTAEPPSLATE